MRKDGNDVSDVFQLPRLLLEMEVVGPMLLVRPFATVPLSSYVSVYINGRVQCEGDDYVIDEIGQVWWNSLASFRPTDCDHVFICAWEREPAPPLVLRVLRPTILCSQCGEPMTPGDPRRRRRAKAKPAPGYRCRPCGREVRP